MIGPEAIDEIVLVYRKHGWILRRVLVTPDLKRVLLGAGSKLLQDPGIVDSDIDAAWFSRPPQEGGVPWEIRHLSKTPYALLENVDEYGEGFEGALSAVEERLRAATLPNKTA